MKTFWKTFFVFLGLVLFWCSLSISGQFLHELSLKDWISHIIFAILFAVGYMLIVARHKKAKAKKENTENL
jgi:uncharacterized membrane protein YagU involved in acid resistance